MGALVLYPGRGLEKLVSGCSCLTRCQHRPMLGIDPHQDIAVYVLHGSDLDPATVVGIYR